LQALVKLALEPEWEARFDPNSYGFRTGRSCHEDPCEGKLSSTALKTNGVGDNLVEFNNETQQANGIYVNAIAKHFTCCINKPRIAIILHFFTSYRTKGDPKYLTSTTQRIKEFPL
jgi:hypothetical protein